MKFLRVGDSKYRAFFIRRIEQLAAGDRSRIIAKRLTGSNTIIYKTYQEKSLAVESFGARVATEACLSGT
jgi:hypothetical protein